MSKFACLLVCLAVLVNTGLALKCYSCRGETQKDCIEDGKEVECTKLAASVPVCYSVQTHDAQNKLVWNYDCGLVLQGETIDPVNLLICLTPNSKNCKVCNEDLCNSN